MGMNMNELLGSGQFHCKWTGECIEREVRRLQFAGAGVSEFRGLSDTGLSVQTLLTILDFTISVGLYDEICNYLDGHLDE